MQSFYETGFYQFGFRSFESKHRTEAVPLLRQLDRETLAEDHEIQPLTITALKMSFTITFYAYLSGIIAFIPEKSRSKIERILA